MPVPTSISGCFFWYSADQIGAPNNTPVTYWLDGSGSGNNATPIASSNLPILYTNVINGLPAVAFNGTSSYLEVSSSNLQPNANKNTVFTVFQPLCATGVQSIISVGRVVGNGALVVGLNKPSTSGFFHDGGGIVVSGVSPSTNTVVYNQGQWIVRYDSFVTGSNYLQFGLNGAILSGGSITPLTTTLQSIFLGNGAQTSYHNTFFSGYIAEVIGYNNQLSDTDVNTVNTYLISKYNINPNPPTPPFTDPSSYSGLFAWFRASSIGLTVDNSNVIYWKDDSGSGNHCTYYNGSSGSWNFPTYHPNQINGWPTVKFTNGAYYGFLQGSINNSLQFSPGDLTTFCVFNCIDGVDTQSVFSVSDASFSPDVFDISLNKNLNGFDFYQDGNNVISASSATFGFHMYDPSTFMIRGDRFRQTDGAFIFSRYGADISSGTTTTDVVDNPVFSLGYDTAKSSNYLGDIAEVICYSPRLSESQVSKVNTYLLQKYLPGNLGTAPLYLYSSSSSSTGIYNTCSLYTESGLSGITTHIPLYIPTSPIIFSGFPLSAKGIGLSSNNFSLYTLASTQQFPPIPLYAQGGSSASGFVPLYVENHSFLNKNVLLYISGSQPPINANGVTGIMPLYLFNVPLPQNSGNIPLFLYSPSTTGNINSVYDSIPLYLEAGSINSTMPLVIGAEKVSTHPSSQMPLFLMTSLATGIQTLPFNIFLCNNFEATGNYRKLYIRGFGSLNEGLPIDSTMNMYLS